MSVFVSDRNLLIGVLGLQMGLVSESALIAGMQSWVFRKSVGLEDILKEQRVLNDESCRFLKSIAEQHMRLHGDDAAASLASVSSIGPLRKQLQEIGDPALDLTITRIGDLRKKRIEEQDSDSTKSGFSLAANERFRVIRPHAKGGLGVVSVAEDLELHREVALKEIQPEFVQDSSSRTRFLVEAEITGRLEHPGIVPVYGLGTTDAGTPFYVMRFIHGDSLKDAIAAFHKDCGSWDSDERRLNLRKLVRRLVDVCNAIEYAHSKGVLHRDLKPGNIMLGKYGETLVVDWGLARTGANSAFDRRPDDTTFVALSSDVSSETRTGSVVGTLAYMSPEQAEGRLDELGPQSDVYSLGATLYCLLTGRQPVPRGEPESMLRIVREGLIEPPGRINPETPKAIEAICRKAMSREPVRRYPSARHLASDLELWLADEPVVAYSESLMDRAARFARHHRTAVVSATGILVTITVAMAVFNSVLGRKNDTLTVANRTISDKNAELQLAHSDLEQQKNTALENLSEARGLAVLLLDMAEERLSGAAFDPKEAVRMRSDATEAAFRTFADLYNSNPKDWSTVFEYARTARTAGNLKRSSGDFNTALERYQLALDLFNRIPSTAHERDMRLFLSELHREIGTLRKAEGKLVSSFSSLDQALKIAIDELQADSGDVKVARVVSAAELELSGYYLEMMQLEKALELVQSGSIHLDTAIRSPTATHQDRIVQLLLIAKRLFLLTELARFDEVQVAGESGKMVARELQKASPRDANIALGYARVLTWSAEGLAMQSNVSAEVLQAALTDVEEVIGVIGKTIQQSGQTAGAISSLADAYRIQGLILARQNKWTESDAALGKALQYSKAIQAALDWAEFHELTARILHQQSRNLSAAGDRPAADRRLEESRSEIRKATELSPESEWVKHIEKRINN